MNTTVVMIMCGVFIAALTLGVVLLGKIIIEMRKRK